MFREPSVCQEGHWNIEMAIRISIVLSVFASTPNTGRSHPVMFYVSLPLELLGVTPAMAAHSLPGRVIDITILNSKLGIQPQVLWIQLSMVGHQS